MKNHRSIRSGIAALAAALLLAAATGLSGVRAASAPNHQEMKNIVETAVGAGGFTTLVKALQAAELVGALEGEGPFTVFAPTDEAFARLPAGALEDLSKPENKEKLKAVLLYHVVPGKVTAADVMKLDSREVKTLEGSSVKVKVKTKDGVMVDKARVVRTDVMATNGVIHVIDTVIMPKMK